MFTILSSIAIFLFVSLANCREICYEGYGCFKDTPPFGGTYQRPFNVLPDPPQKIATKFTLYRRDIPSGEQISPGQLNTSYNSLLLTKIISHGFLHNGLKKWVLDMKDALLRAENVNVIVLDWSKMNGFPYTHSTANTRVVGVDVAKLIKSLVANNEAKLEDFHLIGHSLGAHIFGYTGEIVPGIGRITGLDPAGPYFENGDPILRLDPSDALYVDVIHTDGMSTLKLGLGIFQASGHVDFYPNGGVNQPKCPGTSGKLLGAVFNLATLSVDGIEESVACSHNSAITLFTDSIENKCKYTAYPCNSKDDFDMGKCIECSSKGCNRMGYWSSPSKDQGVLYLNTQPPTKSPSCKQNYLVRLVSSKLPGQIQGRGKITLLFQTKNKISSAEVLDNSDVTFKPGSEEVRLVSLDSPIDDGDIQTAFVSYTKTSNLMSSWLYDEKWSFKYIEIFSGDEQKLARFCPPSYTLQSGTVEFKRCNITL